MMTPHYSTRRRLGASIALLALSCSGAFAQDATAVANRLKAVLATQGTDLNWTAVTQNAGAIQIEGVTAGMIGVPDRAPIGNITLSGVTEVNGGFRVNEVTLPNYDFGQGGFGIQITGIKLAGLSLPSEGSQDPLAGILMYERGEVASMLVKMAGNTLFTLTDFNAVMTAPVDGKPLTFEAAAEKITADLSTTPDPKVKAVLDALGYTTMSGFVQLAGTYQPTDGRMVISKYDLSVENAGTLGMTFDIGGYTPAFIKSMQDMQKKMAEQPAGADQSAQGLAMLGLMQQLTFQSASVRFDDQSLTGKVLDYIGKQQGVAAGDIANQAKAVAPFLLTQLNNPELTASVSAAVSKFLDNPKSFEISAQPAAPVPFALIAAGAMSTPQELPKTLGVTVTANE